MGKCSINYDLYPNDQAELTILFKQFKRKTQLGNRLDSDNKVFNEVSNIMTSEYSTIVTENFN